MRKLLTLLAVVAAFGLTAGPANAILYGEPDNNAHPYVGMVRFWDAQGNYLWRCSGSLISSRVFLTAGHCTFGGPAVARVYMTENPPTLAEGAATMGLVGTPIPHPAYNDFAGFPNTHDVGIVKLKKAVRASAIGSLAAENSIGALVDKHQLFDIVGYGVQDVRPEVVAELARIKAEAMLINSTSGFSGGFNLKLSSNNGQPHQGGICFGDSGGPVLLGSTIYAVNSFAVNGNCAGSGFSYRVDLPDIRSWILSQF